MTTKSKVPQIRFKGFSEEWEENKISEKCLISTGKSNTQDKDDDGVYPFYVRSSIIEHSHHYLFDEEAVLTVGDGVGTGKVYHYVNGKYNLHQRVYRIYDFKEIFGRYFYYYFSNKFYSRVMSMTAKTSVDSVRLDMIADMNILYPKLVEQTKIGNYFQQLDKRIEQKEKKYQKLKQFKKAMLDKMFPKNGADIPEIRFKGFSGKWEEKSLDELCSIITKQTGFDYSATIKPSLVNYESNDTYAFIQNKDFEGTNINLQTDFYIPKNVAENFPRILIDQPSVLITISGKIGNVGLYSLSNKAFIGGAVGICKLINYADGLTILYSLLSQKGQSYFKSLVKASSHSNITVEDIRKIRVQIPIENEEKDKIGNYFQKLDNQIDLQQKELEKLKNIKKASLSKMFI